MSVYQRPQFASPSDVDDPAAATAAVVTYGAAAGFSHVISGVAWSYSAAPTGGNLQIEDGTDVVFSMDITTGGAGFITFGVPKKGTRGAALTITLASGAGAVVGKVNALAHWLEA